MFNSNPAYWMEAGVASNSFMTTGTVVPEVIADGVPLPLNMKLGQFVSYGAFVNNHSLEGRGPTQFALPVFNKKRRFDLIAENSTPESHTLPITASPLLVTSKNSFYGLGSVHSRKKLSRRETVLALSISADEFTRTNRRRRKRLRVASNRPLTRLDSVGHFFDRISFNRRRILQRKRRRCACAELPDLVPADSSLEIERTSSRTNTFTEDTTREDQLEGPSETSTERMELGESLATETELRHKASPIRKLDVHRISQIKIEHQAPRGICQVDWTEYVASLRSANQDNEPSSFMFSPVLRKSYAIPEVRLGFTLNKVAECYRTSLPSDNCLLELSADAVGLLKLALLTPQFYFLLRRTTASFFRFFLCHRSATNFCGRCVAKLPEVNETTAQGNNFDLVDSLCADSRIPVQDRRGGYIRSKR
eukprot:Gregarina_sp_Poly_1__114@NODE_1025_length_5317_cov_10_710857_g715_i0_p2_GENE_NODE_1025_length_5317_cov_10_710857_g715_i0NODE_1025_length_5317_cov_10_710857_g715_i0_p2_ORF_typecomplete_len422_score28_36_NODE_1025_length_5317_cov_10_710857_g715_i023883653